VKIHIELTLDEADLVGASICRDRDRLLDESFGYRGTRIISDREEPLVPTHQAILRKIEEALTSSSERPRSVVLNEALDAMIGNDKTSPADDLLGKVRSLCSEFSLGDLRTAIDVHRSSCHQPGCPVLVVMVATAEAREAALAVAKHSPAHQARLTSWSMDELKIHLACLVDTLAVEKELSVSPLDVALELLGGELEAFVLFGRVGHLDPPREDGKVPIGILQRKSEDPEIDVSIRETAKKWAIEQEGRS